jgi:hypothetical protein
LRNRNAVPGGPVYVFILKSLIASVVDNQLLLSYPSRNQRLRAAGSALQKDGHCGDEPRGALAAHILFPEREVEMQASSAVEKITDPVAILVKAIPIQRASASKAPESLP